MKKITIVFLFLIGGMVSSFAQFSENFDAGTTIPAGWSVINGGDANTWTVSTPGTGTAHSGANVVRIYYSATAHNDYLVTPQFTVTAGVTDFLSLWARNRSDTFHEPFDILLSTAGNAEADFTTTIAAAVDPTTAWGQYNYDLAAYNGQTVYIAFKSTTTDEWQLYLDDISVGALPNPLDYVSLQSPATATIAQGGNVTVYGQVLEAGLTDVTSGQAPGIQAWVGYSATNTNPNTWTNWTAATFNMEVGDNDEYQATIGSTLIPGTYYYATRFVQGNGAYVYGGIDASNIGSFWDGTTYLSGVLTVSPPPPPANDECSNSTPLTVNPDYLCGSVTAGTVLGATASAVDSAACFGTEDDDVWYSFEATATTHKISILNASGSTTDMYHSLWTGSDCGSLTLVPGSCSDADNSFPSGLTIGQTYFLRVNTYTATGGQNTTFNVCVGTPPPPPANDDCTGAISLTVNSDFSCTTVTSGTVLGATASAVDSAACFGTEDDDVWYSFEATATTHKISILNASGSTTDMYHSLWTGSDCGSLTLVPGSCSDADSSTPSGLTIGQTYFVRVNTYTATGGQDTTFNICVGSPPPPPANDDCSGAVSLTVNPDYSCAAVTAGTVAGATASAVDSAACFGTEDDDVWYSFEATATTHRISLTNVSGSTTDMYHSLWTGSDCGSLTLVAGSCSDGDTSNPSGLTVGQTYFVRVNTYTATGGQDSTFNICIGTPPPPPTNDDCSGAIDVACGSTTIGTTEGTTNENMPVCGIANVTTQNTNGVWYKYTGDGSEVTVTTCSPTITTGDSRIAVYTGSCGSLTCIGGNDDATAAGCSTNTLASNVTFTTVAGTDYYILVYAYTSNALNFALTVNCTAACSPATANDECSTAMPLTLGSTVVGADNLCSSASLDVNYPTCGNQFLTYFDTWYWFDSGSSTDFTISLANATGANGYALYEGSCGNLTMVTGSCTTTGGNVAVTGLTMGTTYFLRVFSTTTNTRGSYDLTVSETLGNGSFDNGSFTYYPNPVKNALNLSYNQAISSVEVFNMLGQKVSSDKFNANEARVDMSHLSDGAYMVKVTSEGQVKTIKVIKQ
ncbi:T9SS-dependent choice-of-anchor J family protein [Flavobacterium phycosphaerae]|uniref:T9SS-dependent choice-of-anchor J family protein n=1 Tax=Flavobacterium phycosphaerae TaxID=2697515 RepID=UPI00138AE635|nr:choice-of-anchor J domain-containing protein [Flavobacterium phycosphaerae]